MKPRLKSAPLTEEDMQILWGGYRGIPVARGLPERTPFWKGLLAGAAMCDRDAELMYRIEVCRNYERLHHPEDGFGGPWRAFVNLPHVDAAGNITNFA
jgi:hypothetical protein